MLGLTCLEDRTPYCQLTKTTRRHARSEYTFSAPDADAPQDPQAVAAGGGESLGRLLSREHLGGGGGGGAHAPPLYVPRPVVPLRGRPAKEVPPMRLDSPAMPRRLGGAGEGGPGQTEG